MSETVPASLPEAYAGFTPLLARLSEQLQAILAGHLAGFERLLRSVDEPALSTRGEVEGLGGLTTHGDIFQILQSELLLRTEAPVEFLRRMAEAETLYLERQYHDEGLQRVNRLMVSVGPGVLGHGRTLALAALFFMTRISQDRGDLFHWCFMPTGQDVVWFDEISPNSIKRFLKAASYREMTMDDVEDAGETWEKLHPHAKGHAKPMCFDWVIGASVPVHLSPARIAVHQAPNAMSFAIEAPVPEEARRAMLVVRRRGREQKPIAFSFPPDSLCLSALNRPFAPFKAAVGTGVRASLREKMDCREPRYFTAPNSMTRIVRMATGLLVLVAQEKHVFARRCFIPIAADAKLAGVRFFKDMLSILIQDQPGQVERLVYFSTALHPTELQSPTPVVRVKPVPCAQLFRKQPAYALPLLAGVQDQALFYAANGKPFALHFDTGGDVGFDSRVRLSPILHSDGRYRVVRVSADGTELLRVLRNSGSTLADFVLGEEGVSEDRLFGMFYSSAHGRLAYSAMPNLWTVPPPSAPMATADDSAEQFEVAPYEEPLAARARGGFVEATIWSHAARGGDGTVRNLQFRNGEILSTQKEFSLGEDADRIADVKMTDDGLWALALDQHGLPDRLFAYHRSKPDRRPVRTAFELNTLMDGAEEIDVIGMADE